MPTLIVRPTSYSSGVNNSAFGVSNASNIYDSNGDTCGTLSMTGFIFRQTYDIAFKFDCSALPIGATIDSVSITWIGITNYSDRFSGTYIQARYGSSLRGSQTTVNDTNDSNTTVTISGLSYTRTELINDFNVLFYSTHDTISVAYYYLYDLYATISYTVTVVPPTMSLGTPTLTKISDEIGHSQCICSFASDQDLDYWEARAVPHGGSTDRGQGTIVESGNTLSAGVTASIIVDYNELTGGDGQYEITIYGHCINGYWSDGTQETL